MAESDQNEKHLQKVVSWYVENGSPGPCPSEETLGGYIQNTLAPEAREAVERHLARCAACLLALQVTVDSREEATDVAEDPALRPVLDSALALIPAPRSVAAADRFESMQKGFRSFLDGLARLFFLQRPEFVYVRGRKKVISKNLVVLEKLFKRVKLDIEIEKTGDRTAEVKVAAFTPKTGRAMQGVRITLSGDSREIASFVTSGGAVLFENIAFGEYRVEAWSHQEKLGDVRLTIKE